QVLVLLPEIHLTPQLEQRIATTLPGVRATTLHSALGAAERRERWLAAARGDVQLIVGPRLAVFTPLPRLGLIVVDEEHDASFKQQEGLRYSARDLAVLRAKHRRVPVVLGSATPSLESYASALAGRYQLARLPTRAGSRLPSIRCIDTRGQRLHEGLSPALIDALGSTIAS